MPVPQVCVEEILKDEDKLWSGSEPHEIFWTAAEIKEEGLLPRELAGRS